MADAFTTGFSGGVLHITLLVPRLDAALAREIKPQMQEAVRRSNAQVDVDLEQVLFIDSTGVGALIATHNTTPEPLKTKTQLLHASPAVIRTIDLLKLRNIFEFS